MNTAECEVAIVDVVVARGLQWSRRVNTAECVDESTLPPARRRTSMEPPCEHGGVISVESAPWSSRILQWSRRVNTAEWLSNRKKYAAAIELQWSRRVNTAECCLESISQ